MAIWGNFGKKNAHAECGNVLGVSRGVSSIRKRTMVQKDAGEDKCQLLRLS